ncbi:MAG: DNA polymerase III subunit epsilon [Acidiferrobacteraceae bacterium]|nr:DNA polymerase III subunit epsilon [Acidiferrobacteraceae bacterium]
MRQVILDTETTGLEWEEGHRIIEIGCLEIIGRRVTEKRFHTFLNPNRDIDQGALEVHGITTENLADKPVFLEIVEELINFIQGSELIIHNAQFDLGFLDYELSLVNFPITRIQDICQILDTLQLARQLHPGQRNSLDALCKRYGVDNSHRVQHGAMLDAEILADVFLFMTGGQSELQFGNMQTDKKITETSVSIDNSHVNDYSKLLVIKPVEEEIVLHEKWLTLLETGKSLKE